ncbi:MAG: hypothetical protein QGG02_03530 [Gammaproteobacteria bacterium]|jgi:hypothetical protein|nr:hypothetical protein [Gammaproteobacteria bacterium]MDP6732133.1 hypothetical protein [Gammaproteobacteria bacterium]
MSCPKTQHLLQEYFSDDLAGFAREEIEHHLNSCEICSSELEALLLAQSNLQNWQDQGVPHWDRGLDLFKREHRVSETATGFWRWWQWLPTAASFAMLSILLLNLSVVSGEQGFSITFGENSSSEQQFQSQLTEFQELQREEIQALITRVEDRLDSNSVQLLQAVMDQTQQTTADNLDRIYAFFEQQRIRDLEDMRVGYQALVDSDYETIRNLEQLAQFVSYQEPVR